FYHLAGLLDLDPEPEPPSPAAPVPVPCFACRGAGVEHVATGSGVWLTLPCPGCDGTGTGEVDDDADGDDDGRESAPYDHGRSYRPAVRCAVCRDERAVRKASGIKPGTSFLAPCPACVPRIPLPTRPDRLAA
ncbi:MAG: hypothetical protein M3Q10_04460, partial [Chloroflexota bacterium]|nr:hypothetical protein [Chloroflexota bacterium]